MSRNAAVSAARRGWAVFPMHPGTKQPVPKDWPNRACSDPGTVARCWPSDRHNIGIACGPSRLVVLDLDAHGDLPEQWRQLPGVADGLDVFAATCEWAGQPWPPTYTVATAGGGRHLYFTAPGDPAIGCSTSKAGPQIDVKASGGCVVAAGSVVGGRRYEVLDDDGPEPLPGWITRLLAAPKAFAEINPRTCAGVAGPGRLAGLVRTVEQAGRGTRTNVLVWAAFRLRDHIARGEATGDDAEVLVRAAVTAGIRGGERYARRQVASVLGRGTR